MNEQLKELLEMQRILDKNIMKEHGLVYDEHIANNIGVALIVEVGELMNEFPTKFKHWKKSAIDNREKGLVEFCDVLHFVLSLINYYEYDIDFMKEYNKCDTLEQFPNMLHAFLNGICYFTKFSLTHLFQIGNFLGFTWPEIYQAYKDKNAVNYERLKNGY
ncbi:dUTP diphosphatase [Dielma fastidiosa]|uniref:dUTP diphosphatase n=1 Tax=Dielma fastidiosa TaxID=1034346 RepID=UPI00356B2B6D